MKCMLTLYSFVDRDMVMRYEWGFGIGHTYSWKNPALYRHAPDPSAGLPDAEDPDEPDTDAGLQPLEDDVSFRLDDQENEHLGADNDDNDDGDDLEGEASDDGT